MKIGNCWHCKLRTELRRIVLYVTKPYKKLLSRDLCLNCISDMEKEIERKEQEAQQQS